MMKSLKSLILAPLIMSIVSCHSQISEEDVIAQVNDRPISVREYLHLFESMKPHDVELLGEERAKIKNLSLQTLVTKEVVLSAAEAQDIKVSQKELDDAVQKYKEGYEERLFRETLIEGMVEEDYWIEQVRHNLLIEKLFKLSKIQVTPPTPEEALQYYEENQNLYSRKAEVTAEQIVVNDEETAKKILEELKKNPGGFKDLAKEFSIGPEAQDNARISVEKDVMPENLDNYLFSAPLKQISPIIKTEYGYHIVRPLSRKEAVNLDFNQVKTSIYQELYSRKQEKALAEFEQGLIRRADIRYNRDLIAKL